MKTLEEIYAEVSANAELAARFQALKTLEEQVAFVQELGGEASAEEIAAFMNKTGELTDAELDQVVGGKGEDINGTYIHNDCGGLIEFQEAGPFMGSHWRCNKCNQREALLSDFSYTKG